MRLYLIFISLAGLLISCSPSCTVQNIEVSELLLLVAKKNNFQYCELLDKALENDSSAIQALSKFTPSEAAGYDHGGILVDLILKIGHEKYIRGISSLSKGERKHLLSYLKVGLEYGSNPATKSKTIEIEFPELNEFLIHEIE